MGNNIRIVSSLMESTQKWEFRWYLGIKKKKKKALNNLILHLFIHSNRDNMRNVFKCSG